jgi:predicted ATPase/DNA-binding SARP family transcriptional activator/Tfp pilus assembly protein PilF
MSAPLIQIQMLGALRVQQGERLITRFRYQKAAALLAYLAFYRERTHPRELLIERFWPEFSPDAGRNNLSNVLSSLRHQLEPPGTPAGAVLLADRFNVGLRSEVLATDVADFEAHLRAVERETEPSRQIQRLSDALALYAGPLLPGFYEEWIGVEGQRLSDVLLRAARRLVRLLAKAGEGERALEIARRAVAVDPLREEAHRDLIQLYVALGRPSAALAQYRELEGVLDRELGTAPSAATRKCIAGLRERLTAEAAAEGGDGEVLISEAAAPGLQQPLPSALKATAVPGPARRSLSSKAVLPSGTVTFLILAADTTSEQANDPGATERAWERQGDRLRRLFARHGGQVFQANKTELSVVFAGASDALGCALAVWKALEPSQSGMNESDSSQPDEEFLSSHVEADALLQPIPKPRFALHSGDVAPERSDHPESAQQRAQRLALAGHAGQLLCSETTAALLRRDLEPGVQLMDLGLYRLGGGAEAERVWQVAGTGMRATPFPPLRAEAGTPSRLPPQLTRFFGREGEVRRLLMLLRTARETTSLSSAGSIAPEMSAPGEVQRLPHGLRLVTLTGPGGIGKTRLALEAGARLEQDWEGAVWFVPLADLPDASLIPSALVSALGLPPSGAIEPLEQVVSVLGARPALLLLDNFEHLVEEGARLVQALLQRVPTLTCLVTSRQRLEIAGEHEMALSPLPVPTMHDSTSHRRHPMPDNTASQGLRPGTSSHSPEGSSLSDIFLVYESVQLFVDRAQAVRPDFQITPSNATAIAALCAGLEGIPLALELAASRAQVLTPAQMLEQLRDRFTFLVSRRRDAAARHRTLLSAVEWSYRLLPEELKRIFARLSVFRGGWDLAAAEAICTDMDMMPLDALAQLRECSLVLATEQGDAIRFRMLETLREYAQRQLQESGEATSVATRHADYYLAQVEQAAACLLGPEQGGWLDRLEVEHDNLRAALAWCAANVERAETGLRLVGALWLFWERRGHLSEGRSLIARALTRAGKTDHTVAYAHALLGAGRLAYLQGEIAQARAHYEESLALFRQWEDNRGIASALNGLGGMAESQGDSVLARTCLEESLRLHRLAGDKRSVAAVLYNLGRMARGEGDHATARTLHEQALAMDRETGDHRNIALSLLNLATIALEVEDYGAARSLLEECGFLFQQLGDVQGRALWSNRQGELACKEGDYIAARALHQESLKIRWELKDKRGMAESLEQLAEVAMRQAHFQRAVQLIASAAALHESVYGSARLPQPRGEQAGVTAQVRALLGEEAFAVAWSKGQSMSLEQAIEYAMEDSQ